MIEIKSIESFKTGYEFKSFDCGNDELNRYFKTFALINNKNNLSRTFVGIENKQILGFITLCNAQIEFKEMPHEYQKSNPRYPIPAVKIARFAVDKKCQGMGIGTKLLKFAFSKVLQIALNSGTKVVVVNAKAESKEFYEKFGFINLTDNTLVLFVETLIKAL